MDGLTHTKQLLNLLCIVYIRGAHYQNGSEVPVGSLDPYPLPDTAETPAKKDDKNI